MSDKRGQMTLVFAVVIILLGALLVLLHENQEIPLPQTDELVPKDFTSVETFLDQCVKNSVSKRLRQLGLQGGYATIPGIFFSADEGDVPLYFYNGRINLPTLSVVEQELTTLVLEDVADCTHRLEEFEGIESLLREEASVRSVIVPGEVVVSVDLPLRITIGNSSRQLSRFQSQSKVDVSTMLEVAGLIADQIVRDPQVIPTSLLLTLSDRYGISIDAVEYEHDTVLFGIRDSLTDPGKDSFVWLFAAHLNPQVALEVDDES